MTNTNVMISSIMLDILNKAEKLANDLIIDMVYEVDAVPLVQEELERQLYEESKLYNDGNTEYSSILPDNFWNE